MVILGYENMKKLKLRTLRAFINMYVIDGYALVPVRINNFIFFSRTIVRYILHSRGIIVWSFLAIRT